VTAITGRMQVARWIAVFATAGATALAAQTGVAGDTVHCDEIAARLRAYPGLADGTAPTDYLEDLTSGQRPYVVLADAVLDESLSRRSFEARFAATFSPAPGLRRKVSEFMAGGRSGLFSLPGSDLHVIIQTSGSMHCQSFVFFRAVPGQEAMLVPTPAHVEGDCGGDAYLARVGSDIALLEYSQQLMDQTFDFHIVPWRHDQWADGCSVDMAFHLTHRVSNVFVPDKGPLSADQIRSLMPGVAQQWKALHEVASFHIGPAVPPTQQETLERLRAAGIRSGGTKATLSGDVLPEPLEVSGFATLNAAGQLYLVQLGHPHIGWREFPDVLAVVSRLKDDTSYEVESVASAIIAQSQGALDFIHVRAGR
jgi:hypothetical protein